MNLNIGKKDKFVKNFLGSLSKVADNVLLSVNSNIISATCQHNDNSFLIYCEYVLDIPVEEPVRIAIGEITKFIKFLNCLDDEKLVLQVENNYIVSNSPSGNIKFFTYDEKIINKSKINFQNVLSFPFPIEFLIPKGKVQDLIKAIGVNDNAAKLYLSGGDGKITWEITDKNKTCVDSIGKVLHNDYTGISFDNLILNTENIKILNSTDVDFYKFRINNEKMILLISMEDEYVKKNYLLASLKN